jgi:hypothetical protein
MITLADWNANGELRTRLIVVKIFILTEGSRTRAIYTA